MDRVTISVLLLFLIQSIWVAPASGASGLIRLDTELSVDLYGKMEYYGDAAGTRGLVNILSPEQQVQFRHLNGNLNDGFAHKAVWVRLNIQRSARFPSVAYLRLNPPILDHVTVYVQNGADPSKATSYCEARLGDLIPPAKRLVRHQDIIVPISLPKEVPVTVYLRIQSASPVYLKGSIHSFDDLSRETIKYLLFTGIVSTLIALIAFWTYLYYFYTREIIFMIFSLYGCSVLLSFLALAGVPALLLFPDSPFFSEILFGVGSSGEVVFYIMIVVRVLQSSLKPWAKRFFDFMTVLAILNTLTIFLGFQAEVALVIAWCGIVVSVLVFYYGFYEDSQLLPDGKLYLKSLQTLNFAYLLFYMRQVGIIPFEWWSSSSFQVAAVINIIILPIYMMRRILASKQHALEVSMSSEANALAYARDVTKELQENKERLEIALATEQISNERQQIFFNMLSHEYRTPLAIIQGNINIIEDEFRLISSEEVSKINVAINRLIELMDVSLERSRLLAPQTVKQYQKVLAGDIAKGQVRFAEWLWGDCRFVFSDQTGTERIYGDIALLSTAFFNLLENAHKYSSPGAPIDVSCGMHGNYIKYIIRNLSADFDSTNTETLFEKYVRGGNSSNTVGAGLGLYLVRWIVTQHDGHISLDRDNEGFVTTTMLIPVSR